MIVSVPQRIHLSTAEENPQEASKRIMAELLGMEDLLLTMFPRWHLCTRVPRGNRFCLLVYQYLIKPNSSVPVLQTQSVDCILVR